MVIVVNKVNVLLYVQFTDDKKMLSRNQFIKYYTQDIRFQQSYNYGIFSFYFSKYYFERNKLCITQINTFSFKLYLFEYTYISI